MRLYLQSLRHREMTERLSLQNLYTLFRQWVSQPVVLHEAKYFVILVIVCEQLDDGTLHFVCYKRYLVQYKHLKYVSIFKFIQKPPEKQQEWPSLFAASEKPDGDRLITFHCSSLSPPELPLSPSLHVTCIFNRFASLS